MGCDIHLHVEVKINNNWEHWAIRKVENNYNLFAKMANVRNAYNEIAPISHPKGFPRDATLCTKYHSTCFGDCAHSHSWLSSKEVEQLCDWIKENKTIVGNFPETIFFGYLFGNLYGQFLRHKNDYPKEIEDFRFVFFFDN